MEKKPSSKLNFDCIGTFRNIWGENLISHLNNFLINPIWRKIKYDVTRSTPQHEKQKKSYKNSRFHALFHRYVNRCFCNLFPYQPLMTIFSVDEFKPIFYYTNMPNSENCLNHKFSQICNTLCIYIHSLCNKMLINRYFFFFFAWYVGNNEQCLKSEVQKINIKHKQSKHGPFKTRGRVRCHPLLTGQTGCVFCRNRDKYSF